LTTIACDGKSMAADSQTSNGQIYGYGQKVWRAPDGRIFGACGDTAQCIKFRRWMMEGGEFPKLNESLTALILNPDGTVDWIDEDGEMIRMMTPCSAGSGGDFATGAMEAGATPEEAVAIAAKRDTGTGGVITVLHLEEGSKASPASRA
jgi:hypothetical protein